MSQLTSIQKQNKIKTKSRHFLEKKKSISTVITATNSNRHIEVRRDWIQLNKYIFFVFSVHFIYCHGSGALHRLGMVFCFAIWLEECLMLCKEEEKEGENRADTCAVHNLSFIGFGLQVLIYAQASFQCRMNFCQRRCEFASDVFGWIAFEWVFCVLKHAELYRKNIENGSTFLQLT